MPIYVTRILNSIFNKVKTASKLIFSLRKNIKFKSYFLSKNIGKIAYNQIVTVTL